MSRFIFLLPLAAAACTGLPAGERQAPIIGGALDDGDPAAVYLSVLDPQTMDIDSCGAVAISPHVAVTAAHCLDPALIGMGRQFWVLIGNPEMPIARSQWHQASESHFDPLFDTAHPGNDVGVLIFESALPVTPLPMHRAALEQSDIGQPIRLIGFGATDGNNPMSNASYSRQQTSSTLAGFDDGELWIDDPLRSTCEGDSGGPSLMTFDGAEEVVGVHSRGSNADCSGQSYDTRLDAFTSFIDPYVAAADPSYLPPSPTPTPAPMAPHDSGCALGGGASSGAWPLALLLLLWSRRRKRRSNRWCA